MAPALKPHVVIFPFMAHGHTLPLLDLSKALSSQNIKVTIVTTPSNAESILKIISDHHHSYNIHLTELPFPTNINGLPKGCENTSQLPTIDLHPTFLMATKHLQKPFEQLLQSMKDSQNGLPLCVVSDFFLGFTLKVCQGFGIPRLVFHGMGALPMAIAKACWVHKPQLNAKSDSDPLDLPGMKLPFVLTASDLPEDVRNSSDVQNPITQFIEEIGEADVNSWGVIVNTFVELEMGQLSSFESFYRHGSRAWCVGPLYLATNNNIANQPLDSAVKWLHDHQDHSRSGSVIYVSFGTQADVSDAQLDEVAYGLEQSGVSFVWVVRSKTWTPPNDIKERINNKGLIVYSWVDQRRILSHSLVGGFLSHCGWNSVLESISAGVPILAWPMIADQALNTKIVVEGLGAGIRVKKGSGMGLENVVVSRQAICKGVRELMGSGEKGEKVRDRAKALGGVAKRAVEEGGSSFQTLNELIQKLQG